MFFYRRTISACLSVLLTACGGGGDSASNTSATTAALNARDDSSTKTSTSTDDTGGKTGAGGNTSDDSHPTSTASYAYILQAATNAASVSAGTYYTGGSISKCSVDANGVLAGCSTSGMPAVNNPLSIAFSGSTAYIINQFAPDLEGGMGTGGQYPVLACTVNANGTFSACAETYPGNSNETEFAFQLIANSNSSYALKETQVLKCPSNFAGKCGQDPGGAGFPAGMIASDMLFADDHLYVLNAGSASSAGSILSWAVNSATGTLSATSMTATDASFITALRFDDTSGDSPAGMAIKGQNAYIATRYANRVVQCSYSSTAHTMTACVATAPMSALPGITPRHIAIQGSYAYITDSSPTASDNSVIKCTIGSTDGRLGNCAVVPGMGFSTQIAGIVFR